MNKSDKYIISIVAVIMLLIAIFLIISGVSKVFAKSEEYPQPTERQCKEPTPTIEAVTPTIAGASATPVITIIEETHPTGTPAPTVASTITPIPTITGVQFTLTPTMSTITPAPTYTPTPSITMPQGAPVASLREG
mgnify:CR=1 FL=1